MASDNKAFYRNFPAEAAANDILGDDVVEKQPSPNHDKSMSDMNRDEVKARLEANEARVGAALEGMRSDVRVEMTGMRSELSSMRFEMSSHQSRMDATLSQILMAVEKGKSDRYAAGYKIITWSIGTVVALAGLYKAFTIHP